MSPSVYKADVIACRHCHWYVRTYTHRNKCTRNPPTVVSRPEQGGVIETVWPEPKIDDMCGQFMKRPPGVAE